MLTINNYRSALVLVAFIIGASLAAQETLEQEQAFAQLDTSLVANRMHVSEEESEGEFEAHTLAIQSEIRQHIEENIIYTEAFKAQRVGGRVLVALVLDEGGQLSDLAILKGLSKEVDALAIEVMRNLKTKVQSYQGATAIVVPIDFKFE